jgi:hypothetical protein
VTVSLLLLRLSYVRIFFSALRSETPWNCEESQVLTRQVFWVVAPCSLAIVLTMEAAGISGNAGKLLPDYSTQEPRRQPYSPSNCVLSCVARSRFTHKKARGKTLSLCIQICMHIGWIMNKCELNGKKNFQILIPCWCRQEYSSWH